jgi:hypothetical protein
MGGKVDKGEMSRIGREISKDRWKEKKRKYTFLHSES